MNIVLIGYRGSGKSTIGKHLADRLWMDFADTDVLITQKAGKTIREIFEEGGEPAFRDLEEQVVQEVAQRDNLVIAAGGGVVLRPINVERLQANGKLIWLQADADVLYQRIQADTQSAATRPNLTAAGGLDEVTSLLAVRAPLYKAAAHASLDVSRLDVEHAVYYLTQMV